MKLGAGAICSHTLSKDTEQMTAAEFSALLDSPAICMSVPDWTSMHTSLEQACRLLGRRCQYVPPPGK